MKMKKIVALWMVLCLSMGGCAFSQANKDENTAPVVDPSSVATDEFYTIDGEHSDGAHIISPLPDTTMENLTDAILSISLDEGNAYVDDNGRMQMDLKIYTYDKYDMVEDLVPGGSFLRRS